MRPKTTSDEKLGEGIRDRVTKRLNIHTVYQFSQTDRDVFKQVLQELKNCFSVLQKYLDKIGPR